MVIPAFSGIIASITQPCYSNSEFFQLSEESQETESTASDAAAQLMQLLTDSPELAEHLLQMTQLLRAKE